MTSCTSVQDAREATSGTGVARAATSKVARTSKLKAIGKENIICKEIRRILVARTNTN